LADVLTAVQAVAGVSNRPSVAARFLPTDQEVEVALATDPAEIGPRIRELGGDPAGLGGAGADRSRLDAALAAILARPELAFTPDPPDRAELTELIEAAW